MTTNLTEAEIMDIVTQMTEDKILRDVDAGLDPEKFISTNMFTTMQAIAKEYERRGRQRDKLLEGLKRVESLLDSTEMSVKHYRYIKELIAECEGKE